MPTAPATSNASVDGSGTTVSTRLSPCTERLTEKPSIVPLVLVPEPLTLRAAGLPPLARKSGQ
jgi:hypothetical protein